MDIVLYMLLTPPPHLPGEQIERDVEKDCIMMVDFVLYLLLTPPPHLPGEQIERDMEKDGAARELILGS